MLKVWLHGKEKARATSSRQRGVPFGIEMKMTGEWDVSSNIIYVEVRTINIVPASAYSEIIFTNDILKKMEQEFLYDNQSEMMLKVDDITDDRIVTEGVNGPIIMHRKP
ncbi:hypothetical protein [Pontibacter populi]|uniref:Uncharacterized protein n=1 Tax=Pontibacter populi TaxID=890055 RepID=A0ABV1RVM8_9BACT